MRHAPGKVVTLLSVPVLWGSKPTFLFSLLRLVHLPLLYKHIHKKHHEWTAPIGVVSIYAHPLEHIVQPVLRSPGSTGLSAWNRHGVQTNQSLREAQGPPQPHPSLRKHPGDTQEGRVTSNPAACILAEPSDKES